MDAADEGYGTSQMPLAGAILCCTSISPEQRTELAAIGSQMGATIRLDLTSDVTHLIVGNINSAKYRYVAKAREDVKVLAPEWLEALRTVWMDGDDVDVAALERQYRLPTFYGLKICLTGFDDPDQRKFIQETVVQSGAEYHGDLTKGVTHLIAATPFGKKYEHAVNWRTKIVSWEWFEHSRERGMALDENYYHPTTAVEERGKGAWDRKQSTSPTVRKRIRDTEQSQLVNPLRRKLRRSASSRMGSQSQALWAGITAAGSETKKDVEDDWTEDDLARLGPPREDAQTTQSSDVAIVPQDDAQLEDPASQSRQPFTLPTNRKDGLFQGRTVFTHGFDEEKTNILRQHLDSNGATVIQKPTDIEIFSSDDLRRGYLVVPHDGLIDLKSLPRGAGEMCLANNWWVERCLHGKFLANPADNVMYKPFDKLSISGFNRLAIHSTAFTGIELLHVTKVIPLIGASYDEMLSAKTSIMVCNTQKPNPEKLKFATEKRIPAVHSTWLWECLRTGELQPFDGYLLNTVAPRAQKPRQKPQASFTEVPTAPLSEEDSAKLQKKKTQTTEHAPRPRNGPPRPRTLDLTLSINPTPVSTTDSSANPNTGTHNSSLEQDEPLTGGFDGAASSPLQDIHPGASVNSARRLSTSSNASTAALDIKANSASTTRSNSRSNAPLKPAPAPRTSRVTKEPTPDSVIPAAYSVISAEDPMITAPSEPAPEVKDYSSIMSDIMARRKAASEKCGTIKEDDKRKRRRQLGRATSTRSNPSTADDLASRASSASEMPNRNADEEGKGNAYVEYQPSQELGWDALGAQEAREQMIRAMGGKVEESGVLVGPIGVVKDIVSDMSGLGRAGRKRRG